MKRALLLLLTVSALGCSKTTVPASLETFIPPVGKLISAGCTEDASGKRYAMSGHLTLSSSMTVDKGHLPLTLCAEVDSNAACKGRGVPVLVSMPGDIDDLWAAAADVKTAAYKTQQGKVSAAALKIHAKNGDATAKDLLDVVVELSTTLHFQTHAVTACDLTLVSATKK